MLAGRLPFEGDSAVSVALKHLSEAPPPISGFRPDVDPNLEAVVQRALAKNPEQRWQSADEFASALKVARANLAVAGDGGQDTAAFAAVPAPVPVGGEEPASAAPLAEPIPLEAEGPPSVPPGAPPPGGEERRRRWPMFTLGLMALALAGLLAYLAISGLLAANKVAVPRVTGEQLVKARAKLDQAGFEVKQTRVRSLAEFDQVLDQDPNAGEKAKEGSTVTLEVSGGPGDVRVPSVEGLPKERALKELNKVDLKVTVDPKASNTVRKDVAIRTVPKEGTSVQRGTRIRLFVSSGPEQVSVPDVVGLSRSSAESEIEDSGLKAAIEEQDSDKPKDEVISQSPTAGTRIERGERVTITISRGKAKVDVPDVEGLSAADAARVLRTAGLHPARRTRSVDNQDDDGVVIEQRPTGGSQADKGSSVVIVVGRFQQPDQVQPGPTPTP
jgi:eukaryotic-like serine/threonine-protein kinase